MAVEKVAFTHTVHDLCLPLLAVKSKTLSTLDFHIPNLPRQSNNCSSSIKKNTQHHNTWQFGHQHRITDKDSFLVHDLGNLLYYISN